MIHILAYLCEHDHPNVFVAYDPEGVGREKAEIKMHELRKELEAHPSCAICGSTNFHHDDRETHYRTMSEAGPFLKRLALRECVAFMNAQQAKQN